MGMPVKPLETLARKQGMFGEYEAIGVLVCDAQLNRGWYINLEGYFRNSFAVFDGKIHPSGRHFIQGPGNTRLAPVSPQIANLPESTERAIFNAIATWESEEERPELALKRIAQECGS
jgi:hypothetical protein